jgi:hypothetical protein
MISVDNKVWYQLRLQVGRHVRDQVCTQAQYQVWDQGIEQAWGQVRNQVKHEISL